MKPKVAAEDANAKKTRKRDSKAKEKMEQQVSKCSSSNPSTTPLVASESKVDQVGVAQAESDDTLNKALTMPCSSSKKNGVTPSPLPEGMPLPSPVSQKKILLQEAVLQAESSCLSTSKKLVAK